MHCHSDSTEGRVTCQILEGSLPPGMLFHGHWLEGIPIQTGSFKFIIQATDEIQQQAKAEFDLDVVLPPARPLTLLDHLLPPCVVCEPYQITLPVEGGYPPYAWDLIEGKLPEGLSIQDCNINGIVRQSITTEMPQVFTVRVRDTLGFSASQRFSFALSPNPHIAMFLDAPAGGLSNVPVPITLPLAIAGQPYTARLPIHGGLGATRFTILGSLPTSLQLQNHTVTGLPQHPCESTFEVLAQDELGQKVQGLFLLKILPPLPPPLRITTHELPPALLAEQYTAVLRSEGGYNPFKWQIVKGTLPSWAILRGDVIQGTPTNISDLGEARIEVKVSDSIGIEVGPTSLMIRVAANNRFPPPKVKSSKLAVGNVGLPYHVMLPITGGLPPYRLEVLQSSPPGLNVNADGDIQGIPQTPGTFLLSLRISDSLGQSSTQESDLIVLAPQNTSSVPPTVLNSQQLSPERKLRTFLGGIVMGLFCAAILTVGINRFRENRFTRR